MAKRNFDFLAHQIKYNFPNRIQFDCKFVEIWSVWDDRGFSRTDFEKPIKTVGTFLYPSGLGESLQKSIVLHLPGIMYVYSRYRPIGYWRLEKYSITIQKKLLKISFQLVLLMPSYPVYNFFSWRFFSHSWSHFLWISLWVNDYSFLPIFHAEYDFVTFIDFECLTFAGQLTTSSKIIILEAEWLPNVVNESATLY